MPWIFWIFVAIATVRPGGLPACPTGSHFDQAAKACVQNVDDRDLGRGEPSAAPAQPEIVLDPYCLE